MDIVWDESLALEGRAGYYGQIGDHQVPAYVNEEGVNPRHGTETFAEMELELDNWHWPGTVFRLRTGKALGRDRKEVAVLRLGMGRHQPAG